MTLDLNTMAMEWQEFYNKKRPHSSLNGKTPMHHYILIDYQIVYTLKGRLLKNLLVFSQKIDDLTIFFIASRRTEGKEAKTALSGPD